MTIKRTEIGYWELEKKPTEEELAAFYRSDYFGGHDNQYQYEYSEEELQRNTMTFVEAEQFAPKNGKTVLDVGCGEGFFMQHFLDLGWDVRGIDFTLDGITKFFPALQDRVTAGNLFTEIARLATEHKTFDYVVCNGVLHHVIDPMQMLTGLRKLVAPGGVCRITTPNDDNTLQREVIKREFAKDRYWVHEAPFLNYFNVGSFTQALEAAGFTVSAMLSEFPVEIFLFNPDSNYEADETKGRNAHHARVMIETTLFQSSISGLIEFRKGCAAAGIGRNLVAYCSIQK